MSLPDSLLLSLDNPAQFTQVADEYLQSRQALIDRLVLENDLPALNDLLAEEKDNHLQLHAELIKIRDVLANIKKIEAYSLA